MRRNLGRGMLIFILPIFLGVISGDLSAQQSEREDEVGSYPPLSLRELYDKSYAVVIGINKYEKWPGLECAVPDALEMKRRLEAMGFGVVTLLDHQATRSNVMKVLGDDLPRKVKKNDRVLIFFAGHGQTEELADRTQMGYIIPVDADTRDLFSTAISMDQVRAFSRRLRAKHVFYLIDSCYSGLGLSRSGTILPTETDYLRTITSRKAHQMLTAGGKGEQAREERGHGIFTKCVLEAIGGAADLEGKGFVTFTDMAAYVRNKVTRLSGNTQMPQYGNLDGEGEFVFVLKEAQAEREEERRKLEEERRRLEEERARLAALEQQQKEEQARLEEERRRLDAEAEGEGGTETIGEANPGEAGGRKTEAG